MTATKKDREMKHRILGSIFLLLGLLMLFHHFYITGRFFDLADILNHEFFEAILFTAGIVLLVSSFCARVG